MVEIVGDINIVLEAPIHEDTNHPTVYMYVNRLNVFTGVSVCMMVVVIQIIVTINNIWTNYPEVLYCFFFFFDT